MICGSCPSARNGRLTQCALRHTSMPTMQGGSFLNVSASANPPDLSTERDLPVGVKANSMKNIFSNVDADRCQHGYGVLCSCFHRLLLLLHCEVSLTDYPAEGSSRSIRLADINCSVERAIRFETTLGTVSVRTAFMAVTMLSCKRGEKGRSCFSSRTNVRLLIFATPYLAPRPLSQGIPDRLSGVSRIVYRWPRTL
jgi:hypothetical protein